MADGPKKLPLVGSGGSDLFERLLRGESAEVIAALRDHLGDEPADGAAWLKLATAYLYVDHLPEAAEAFERAVQIEGGHLEARRLYADTLRRLRRHEEAAAQLREAVRLAPEDGAVARALGLALYDARRFDEARSELQRAAGLDPSDAKVHFALGLVHEARGAIASAIVAYREAVRCDPELVEARQTLADALASIGEMQRAVDELQQAQRRDRTNMQIAANLEVLARGLKELEAARLLGKELGAVEACTVVTKGQLVRRAASDETDAWQARYGSELAELWVGFDAAQTVVRLMLVLVDPARAAEASGEPFEVTIVRERGDQVSADFATAISITFLREALGCPMTKASQLYGRLIREQAELSWGGARLGFAQARQRERAVYGLYVERDAG